MVTRLRRKPVGRRRTRTRARRSTRSRRIVRGAGELGAGTRLRRGRRSATRARRSAATRRTLRNRGLLGRSSRTRPRPVRGAAAGTATSGQSASGVLGLIQLAQQAVRTGQGNYPLPQLGGMTALQWLNQNGYGVPPGDNTPGPSGAPPGLPGDTAFGPQQVTGGDDFDVWLMAVINAFVQFLRLQGII